MSRISRNVSIILRAERTIARRQFRIVCLQIGLMAMAGLIAIIGLVMLNVAAFMALTERLGPAPAAASVAGVNLAIACLLAWIAGQFSASDDIAPLVEVRNMAMEDLEAEIDMATEQVVELTDGVKQLVRDPLGTVGSSMIIPLVTAVLSVAKKKDGTSDTSEDDVDPSL